MVLSTRIMFKEAHIPKSRGASGTGFTQAPISLFELYLAIYACSTSYWEIDSLSGSVLPARKVMIFKVEIFFLLEE